jgi:hypothetical protein
MAARPPLTPAERALRTAHRNLGLVGAVILVCLVCTGIALQHPDALGLDRHHVSSPALVDWLGVDAPEPVAFEAGGREVTGVGEQMSLDGAPLDSTVGTLLGAVAQGATLVLVAVDDALLLDGDGALIDRLDLPAHARRAGMHGGRVVIDTAAGTFALDASLTTWMPFDGVGAVEWCRPAPLDEARRAALRAAYLARAVTWERALRELHSGRAFGAYGPLVVDVAAILVLILAATGLWMARHR